MASTPEAINNGEGEAPQAPPARGCWACTGLFLLALVPALYYARPLVLPILLAILLNFLLSPAVRTLKRWGLPSPIGSGLMVISLLALLGLGIWQFAAPASEWFARAPTAVQQLQQKLRPIKKSVEQVQKATEEVEKATEVADANAPQVTVKGPSMMARLVENAHDFALGAAMMLVLLYFLMASEDFFLRKLVRAIPGLRTKIRAVEIGRGIEMEIGRYFSAFAILNVCYGFLIAGVLYLLDLPNPALWGLMVGVLNFVPYLGPIISTTVIAIVSLLTFNELSEAIVPPLVFMCIDAMEGNVVEPMLFGRSLSMNPVAIFVALLFWGFLWGAAGILLAVPILLAIKITCERIESLQPIAEFLART